MQLVFIRHGDPDYATDSLTDLGKQQAKALGRYLQNKHFDKIYCSPLGRAQQTALACFDALQVQTADWLCEFWHELTLSDGTRQGNWDFLPSYFCGKDDFYNAEKYLTMPDMASGNVQKDFVEVTAQFDKMLAANGYLRKGRYYTVTHGNTDKIALVCHFGITCVLLSHLTGIPYVLLAQHFFASPTSITTVVTEERQQGIAQFRCIGFGEAPHLAVDGQPHGFSGRFCETFDSTDRH